MRLRIASDKILIFSFFISVILIGSLFLSVPGVFAAGKLRYIDALFTATSAVCVTGLITVDTPDFSLLGQSIIMILIQVGGLGIITFSTIFLSTSRRRISIVGRGVVGEYTISEVEYKPKAIIKAIIKYTFIFEAVGFFFYILAFGGKGLRVFDALFHAVSAFCNAGFSTFRNSLENYVTNPLVNLNTMFLIISGGLGFLVIKDIRKSLTGQRKHLSYHSTIVLKTTIGLLAAGTIAFFILEKDQSFAGLNFFQKLLASLFQATTPRTAGFDTISQSGLSQGSQLLTILLMFIGASPASTGGGIKTTTFYILLITAFRYRDSSDLVSYGKRRLQPRLIFKAAGVVVKALLIVLAASVALIIMETGSGLSLADAVFEIVSAFGTVGLSKGITADLRDISKVILILTMFTGRVGLFAFALPKTRRDVDGYAELPNAEVLI